MSLPSITRVADAYEKLSWDVLPGMRTVHRGTYLPREIRDTDPNVDPQERRNFKHGIQPGEIYYASWGYPQTNVDFYEVVAVGDKSISVREVESKTVSERGADYVSAVPGKYVGSLMKKVPSANGFRVDSATATKWDGKPKPK